MSPTFDDGDQLVVDADAYSGGAAIAVGDIVCAHHPFKRTYLVKRVSEIRADGRIFLLGDNASESTDSRSFGALRTDAIIGKVACRRPSDDRAVEAGTERLD